MGLTDRVKRAWNAFQAEEQARPDFTVHEGMTYTSRPDRPMLHLGNEKSVIGAIYNRIALDVASVDIKHVRLDQNGVFKEILQTGLNECLTIDANVDQTGRALIFDTVLSMFDEGCIAVVPTDATMDIRKTGSFDVLSLRTAKIKQWRPRTLRVEIYNEATGRHQEVDVPKNHTAVIENPFYSIMNEQNSVLKRLVHKMNALDAIDKQSGSSKLDLIIQLPYTIKSDLRQEQADKRKKKIEEQLENSKYGIAYIDSTEHVTQLNRPVDNNLMSQIEYLTRMLYSQLGITEEVMNGTADEKTMLNYNNRTIGPIVTTICEEMTRKFLTKTARSQGQSIEFFNDPFKLVPVSQIAEIADKFTRNEIMSSNEIRGIVGYKPVDDPRADELRNKNLNQTAEEAQAPPSVSEDYGYDEEDQW